MKECKILLVEDNAADAELMLRELLKSNLEFTSKRVETEEQFIKALTQFGPDIIISDQALPHFDAFSAMRILKNMRSEVPFLLATGTLSDDEAVEYLRWGAYDYILKENLARLPYMVKNAMSKFTLLQEKRKMELGQMRMRRTQRVSVEKNKDMIDSMIYAKGIQNALMPKQSYIHQYFPESFLINMPKHIVSGDFYWFSECDGKFIVAVGDCTGHGVPAALISMMGYNKLDHIVNVSGITEPSIILSSLNSEIRDAFRNENRKDSINDGMDISVCVIDRKSNTVEFAGANRPLYYFKNNELEIIKGDKKCIGGNSEEGDAKYTRHVLSLDSLNAIYLFTDGFLDQFGGECGKKFLSKRFKNLVSSTHAFNMGEQKRILMNTLQEWKGEAEQTDDICVLGIRL